VGQLIEVILTPARVTRGYMEKLLTGIRPEQAARKPRYETNAATITVDTNHPSFVIGHLGLYPARLLQLAGLDGTSVAAPAEWEPLFKAGVACQDDPNGKIYPAFDSLVAHYFKATDAVFSKLAQVDDAALLMPTPEERYRERFPLAGAALNFMINNHVMVHMGQLSAWRRCFGLPSAM